MTNIYFLEISDNIFLQRLYQHTITTKCSETVNCSKFISFCGTKPDILIITSSDTGFPLRYSSPLKFPKL